jgi:hypothetical protein
MSFDKRRVGQDVQFHWTLLLRNGVSTAPFVGHEPLERRVFERISPTYLLRSRLAFMIMGVPRGNMNERRLYGILVMLLMGL